MVYDPSSVPGGPAAALGAPEPADGPADGGVEVAGVWLGVCCSVGDCRPGAVGVVRPLGEADPLALVVPVGLVMMMISGAATTSSRTTMVLSSTGVSRLRRPGTGAGS